MYSSISRPVRFDFAGGFRIFDAKGVEIQFPIAKGAAIIAYLALSPSDRASRGELTGLLWSERPEATARTALRQCLHKMKSLLSNIDPHLLKITKDSVILDRDRLSTDVDFDEASCPNNYSPSNILKGLEDLDPAFAEWLHVARTQAEQQLRSKLLQRLEDKSLTHKVRLDAAKALHNIDPSREIAARLLIEDAIARNDPVSLLEVYNSLWNALDNDWGEEPSAELQAIVGEGRTRMHAPRQNEPVLGAKSGQKYLTVFSLRIKSTGNEGSAVKHVKLKDAISSANAIVAEHGGTTLKVHEEGFDAVFGLPSARETDARFAIEAALATRREIGGNDWSASAIGLTSGIMEVDAEAGGEGRYDVNGAAIEHAGLLSTKSMDCSIFATEPTIRRLNDNYVTLKEESFPDIGTNVVRVISRKPAHGPKLIPEWAKSFVGRSPFLAALNAAWEEATSANSLQMLTIQGQAGVGKTRMANHFMNALERSDVIIGRATCARLDRSAPLDPFLALLNTLDNQSNDARSSPLEAESDPQIVANLLFEAVGGKRAVFLFDDWQWADDATRLALRRFTTLEHTSPILVLLTSRSEPTEGWLHAASQTLVLPNMNVSEVRTKAASLLGHPLERQECQKIYEKSGGNPLFLEEICHAIAQTGQPAGIAEDTVADSLPATLQSLLSSRIDRLAPEDLDVVHAASVHGDQLEPKLLSQVLEKTIPEATILRLCALDVLTPAGTLDAPRFKHGIARDVVYRMIPKERRRSLHLRYAERLKAEAGTGPDADFRIAEKLALHYRGAENYQLALHYAELSGDKALRASSLDQAMWHYEVAMDMINELPKDERSVRRWISISKRWAVPCIYAASPAHFPNLAQAENLAAKLGDDQSACEARYWIGYLHFVLGDHTQALENLRKAAEKAKEIEYHRMFAEAIAVEGCTLAALARYEDAEATMRHAISLKERNPGKQGRAPVTSVYARSNLALLLADRGEFNTADTLFEEALSRVHGFEHEVESSILNFAAATRIWRGEWATALKQAALSRERSETVSSPYLIGMSRCLWGYAKWRVDGSKKGLEMLAHSADWMNSKGMKLYSSFIFGWLADAMAETGQEVETRRALDYAQERARSGEVVGLAMALRAAAKCDLRQGNFSEAEAHLKEADSSARYRIALHDLGANALGFAELAAAKGNLTEAKEHLKKARKIFTPLKLTFRERQADELESRL